MYVQNAPRMKWATVKIFIFASINSQVLFIFHLWFKFIFCLRVFCLLRHFRNPNLTNVHSYKKDKYNYINYYFLMLYGRYLILILNFVFHYWYCSIAVFQQMLNLKKIVNDKNECEECFAVQLRFEDKCKKQWYHCPVYIYRNFICCNCFDLICRSVQSAAGLPCCMTRYIQLCIIDCVVIEQDIGHICPVESFFGSNWNLYWLNWKLYWPNWNLYWL